MQPLYLAPVFEDLTEAKGTIFALSHRAVKEQQKASESLCPSGSV